MQGVRFSRKDTVHWVLSTDLREYSARLADTIVDVGTDLEESACNGDRYLSHLG
jgi:hypothetical protein